MTYPLSDTDLILNSDGSIYHLSLHPEHISDTIIAVGDPSRVHLVSKHFERVDYEMNKREFITHVGMYKGKRITVISTGMGTDNVEIVMTELDALANIDFKTRQPKPSKKRLKIIRVGTSGSIQKDIPVGTHLMTEYAIGLDTLAHFYTLEMGSFEHELCEKLQAEIGLPFLPYCVRGSETLIEQFRPGMTVGNTVTCPGFYAPQGRSLRVPIRFPEITQKLEYFHLHNQWLTNLEMETGGYYMLASLLGHDILSVNAILANRITGEFSEEPNKVVDSLITKVLDSL